MVNEMCLETVIEPIYGLKDQGRERENNPAIPSQGGKYILHTASEEEQVNQKQR